MKGTVEDGQHQMTDERNGLGREQKGTKLSLERERAHTTPRVRNEAMGER